MQVNYYEFAKSAKDNTGVVSRGDTQFGCSCARLDSSQSLLNCRYSARVYSDHLSSQDLFHDAGGQHSGDP